MPLAALVAKAGDGLDHVRSSPRSVAWTMLEVLMKADVEGFIGAVLLEANDEW